MHTWMHAHAYTIHLRLSDSAVFGSEGSTAGTVGPWEKEEGESDKYDPQVFQHFSSPLTTVLHILRLKKETHLVHEMNKGKSRI